MPGTRPGRARPAGAQLGALPIRQQVARVAPTPAPRAASLAQQLNHPPQAPRGASMRTGGTGVTARRLTAGAIQVAVALLDGTDTRGVYVVAAARVSASAKR